MIIEKGIVNGIVIDFDGCYEFCFILGEVVLIYFYIGYVI